MQFGILDQSREQVFLKVSKIYFKFDFKLCQCINICSLIGTEAHLLIVGERWHPTPVLLPGKSHGWGAWWATVHGVAKGRTRLSDFTFTFHFHALEKEMATHSSVLVLRIPGMGKPGGLPSMGLQRVGHD